MSTHKNIEATMKQHFCEYDQGKDLSIEALRGKAFLSQRESVLHDCKDICVDGNIDFIKTNHDNKVGV